MKRVDRIREQQIDCIKEKREKWIGLGQIRANRSDWSKRIRQNRADMMRARRAKRIISHCENVRKFDKI